MIPQTNWRVGDTIILEDSLVLNKNIFIPKYENGKVVDVEYIWENKKLVFEAKVLGVAQTWEDDIFVYFSIKNILSGDYKSEEFASKFITNDSIQVYSVAAYKNMMLNTPRGITQLQNYSYKNVINFKEACAENEHKNKFVENQYSEIDNWEQKPLIYS